MSALLLVALLIPVNADAVSFETYYVDHIAYAGTRLFPGNNIIEKIEHDIQAYANSPQPVSYEFHNIDNGILFEANGETTVVIDKVYFSYYDKAQNRYLRDFEFRILVEFTNGEFLYINDFEQTKDGAYNYFKFTFPAPDNVRSIKLMTEITVDSDKVLTEYIGEIGGDGCFTINVNTIDGEQGLLEFIINFLKKIVDGIVNLPTNIWKKISEGLSSLFVPSPEAIDEFYYLMDDLMKERFGALYEVVNITFESWERININDTTDSITLPQTSINLPDGCEFEFGGYDVQVVPDGFSWLALVVKTVTGVISTIAFVNGLRKRYDEVMGVEV